MANETERQINQEVLARAVQFWRTLPHCCGPEDCDADLEGYDHSSKCPLFATEGELNRTQFAALFAESELSTLRKELAEEKERSDRNADDNAILADLSELFLGYREAPAQRIKEAAESKLLSQAKEIEELKRTIRQMKQERAGCI